MSQERYPVGVMLNNVERDRLRAFAVARSLGFTIVHANVLPEAMLGVVGDADGLTTIPLVQPEASQSVGLIMPDRDPPTPLAAAFLALAESVRVSVEWPATPS